jgi:hypothetical protein
MPDFFNYNFPVIPDSLNNNSSGSVSTSSGIGGSGINIPRTPISYIFTDLSKVSTQAETQAFGPLGNSPTEKEKKFNLTNIYTSTADAPAYAVTDGVLFIVPQKPTIQSDPISLVNIFLKPDKVIDLGVKIKYFVCRSVKISSLLVSNGVADYKLLQQNDGNLLPFMSKIWQEYQEFNIGVSSTDVFDAKKVGFNADELKSYQDFFKKGDFNFPKVKIGETIGIFDNTFGFEVVVDEGDFVQEHSDTGFEFKDDFFRAKQCILNLNLDAANKNPSNVYGNLPSNVGEKIFRESVYLFLDPAAYYGSHVTINNNKNEGTVVTPVNECKKPSEIYDVCFKFFNKDKTYLYIKSKRGRSYNFYPSVPPIPPIPNPIEISDNSNNSFSESQWPLRILDIKYNVSFKLNIFSKNCLMVRNIGISKQSIYGTNDLIFGSATPNPTPQSISFVIPSNLGLPYKKVPSIIYLSYDDGIEAQQNNLFGNINLKSIFEREDFTSGQGSFVNHLRPILIKDGEEIGMYQTKVLLEGNYVADNTAPPALSSPPTAAELIELSKNLRTYILFPQDSTLGTTTNPLTAGYYAAKDMEEYVSTIYGSGEIWKGIIKDTTVTGDIKSLLYRRKEGDNNLPIYQLGISQKEYLFLESKAKIADADATNFFFHLEEDTTSTSSNFIKYKLKMQFDKKDGTIGITTDSVALYTIDGLFFFTKDYSANFKYGKEFPKVTAEFLPRDNYNGEFGFDWLRKGDIDTPSIKDKPFNKIISDHYKASDHSVLEDDINEKRGFYKFNRSKYLKLKTKEYKALPVSWKLNSETNDYEKDSTVSYLNLYRKEVTPSPRAKLRLFTRVKNKPKRLYIKYPKDLFIIRLADGITTVDNNNLEGNYRILEIPTASIPANEAKTYINVEIENIADVKQDTAITIHTETGEICGKMIVLKNDDVLIKKIHVVQFRDKLPVDANNVGEQDAEVSGLENINLFLKHANIQIESIPTIFFCKWIHVNIS